MGQPIKKYYGVKLDAVAATASEANRTFTIDCSDETSIDVAIDYTYSAGTSISLTPTGDIGDGTYRNITSRAISAGAGTLSLFADTIEPAASSLGFTATYDVSRAKNFKLVVAVANGDGSDLITAKATGFCR